MSTKGSFAGAEWAANRQLRTLTKRNLIGQQQRFHPFLLRSSDRVHWARIHPNYQGIPIFWALCGCGGKPYNRFEMVRTEDSISCKRCVQSAAALRRG